MAANSGTNPLPLVCKLCEKNYQHKDGPLMLPCLHSFCKPCLTQYIKKEDSADKKMACPTCNNQFSPPKNINQFPINLRLSHLAEATTYEKRIKGGNVKCEKCKGTPKNAVYFSCIRCKFLCYDCKETYQHFVDDDDEDFIDLTNYQKGEFKIHSAPAKCPQHRKQDLALFCNNCKTLICLYCAQTDHQNHEKSSLDQTAESEKAELQQLLTNGIDDALNTMDQTLQQIQEMRDKVKVSEKEATKRINKMCNDLIQAVENRREVLTRKCQEIAEGKDDVLSNQMVEVERLRKDLGYAQAHAKDAVDNHSPEELLSIKKAIKARLDQATEKYQTKSMELREDDSLNTSIEIEPSLTEIQKAGLFPDNPDPLKCHVNGLAVPLAGVGKERKMAVSLKDETDKPVEGKCHFQYQLRKVGEDPDEYIPPKVTITQNNNGTATLGFTPDQPGEYELTIMVRNRPIADPYKITARQPKDYSNFQNMQPTYRNVGNYCYFVAVHDNGTVYATNYNGHSIKVFRPDSTEDQIGSSDNAGGQMSKPRGIALIGDTIYVVSQGNHMVKIYSTDGRFIGGFGGYGTGDGQLSSPHGICTDGRGRVLVADQSNNRIQIFTSEGIFIKFIPCSSQPYDVAVDPVGNIHVALYNNNLIAVYSEDGRQIEPYNLGGTLQKCTGIYIDGEGNRLISTNVSVVYIADPEGTLIASRQVNGLWGVAMDNDGCIYVAESSNYRFSIYYK